MFDKIVMIIFIIIGIGLIIFRSKFALLSLQSHFGTKYNKKYFKAAENTAVMVGIGFIIFCILVLLDIIKIRGR